MENSNNESIWNDLEICYNILEYNKIDIENHDEWEKNSNDHPFQNHNIILFQDSYNHKKEYVYKLNIH